MQTLVFLFDEFANKNSFFNENKKKENQEIASLVLEMEIRFVENITKLHSFHVAAENCDVHNKWSSYKF